jgi:hypothetical protein
VSIQEYRLNHYELECVKVFCPEGKRSVGKPRKLWLEDVKKLKNRVLEAGEKQG